jgi:hypothetical protein
MLPFPILSVLQVQKFSRMFLLVARYRTCIDVYYDITDESYLSPFCSVRGHDMLADALNTRAHAHTHIHELVHYRLHGREQQRCIGIHEH